MRRRIIRAIISQIKLEREVNWLANLSLAKFKVPFNEVFMDYKEQMIVLNEMFADEESFVELAAIDNAMAMLTESIKETITDIYYKNETECITEVDYLLKTIKNG